MSFETLLSRIEDALKGSEDPALLARTLESVIQVEEAKRIRTVYQNLSSSQKLLFHDEAYELTSALTQKKRTRFADARSMAEGEAPAAVVMKKRGKTIPPGDRKNWCSTCRSFRTAADFGTKDSEEVYKTCTNCRCYKIARGCESRLGSDIRKLAEKLKPPSGLELSGLLLSSVESFSSEEERHNSCTDYQTLPTLPPFHSLHEIVYSGRIIPPPPISNPGSA